MGLYEPFRDAKAKVNLSKLCKGIEIAEILPDPTDEWIKRTNADPSNPLRVGSVEFDDCELEDSGNLDWTQIKPLIWWGDHEEAR